MRASVLKDAALVQRAGRFAWLSIDTDKSSNAAVTDKMAAEGVPAFLMIDPKTEKVALKWYGTATAAQLVKLLDDGERALRGGGEGAEAALARADRLNGERKRAEAAEAYRKALELGGPKWARRERTVESLLMAYAFAGNKEACTSAALHEASSLSGRSLVNVVYFGLGCAQAGTPELRELEEWAEKAVTQPGVLGDDVAQLYAELAGTYSGKDKSEAAAQRTWEALWRYLEREAAAARTPEARLAYDSYFATAAIMLTDPARAIPELQRSEKAAPNDPGPPLGLARVYLQAHRYDEALAAAGRALPKAYGSTKVSAYSARAQALKGKGDREGARKTLEEALQFAASLPPGARKSATARFQKQLAEM